MGMLGVQSWGGLASLPDRGSRYSCSNVVVVVVMLQKLNWSAGWNSRDIIVQWSSNSLPGGSSTVTLQIILQKLDLSAG